MATQKCVVILAARVWRDFLICGKARQLGSVAEKALAGASDQPPQNSQTDKQTNLVKADNFTK